MSYIARVSPEVPQIFCFFTQDLLYQLHQTLPTSFQQNRRRRWCCVETLVDDDSNGPTRRHFPLENFDGFYLFILSGWQCPFFRLPATDRLCKQPIPIRIPRDSDNDDSSTDAIVYFDADQFWTESHLEKWEVYVSAIFDFRFSLKKILNKSVVHSTRDNFSIYCSDRLISELIFILVKCEF